MWALRVMTCVAFLGVLLPLQLLGQGVPPMARPEFDALFEQVNNAGRWGAQDERGTLNFITPEVRRAAASEVQTGITVSLAREMVHGEPEGGFGPISVDVLVLSDSVLGPSDGSVVWAAERISLLYHGWSYTHIDALSHMPSYHGRGYNNAPSTQTPTAGQTRNSVASPCLAGRRCSSWWSSCLPSTTTDAAMTRPRQRAGHVLRRSWSDAAALPVRPLPAERLTFSAGAVHAQA